MTVTGRDLALLRKKLGLRQKDVSKHIGCASNYLAILERDRYIDTEKVAPIIRYNYHDNPVIIRYILFLKDVCDKKNNSYPYWMRWFLEKVENETTRDKNKGEIVCYLRTYLGLNVTDVSKDIGCSKQTIYNIERNDFENTTTKPIRKLYLTYLERQAQLNDVYLPKEIAILLEDDGLPCREMFLYD